MDKDTDDLIREYVAAGGNANDWRPSYSIAPTNYAPIIREWQPEDADGPTREVTLAKWDFKPGAGPAPARLIINARFEKLVDRFWIGAFSNTRCIVPMAGYYEWTGEAGDKQPHYIHSDTLLSAAGLYTSHQAEDGTWKREFAIITRGARDASGEIHDRMPAFLTPDLYDQWLAPKSLTVQKNTAASKENRQELVDLLEHSSAAVAATITTHLVDRAVNSTRTVNRYDPELIAAI